MCMLFPNSSLRGRAQESKKETRSRAPLVLSRARCFSFSLPFAYALQATFVLDTEARFSGSKLELKKASVL